MLLMPGATDRYFDVRDNEDELGRLVNAKSAVLHPIPSLHGHRAGNPINNPRDRAFIKAEIAELLGESNRAGVPIMSDATVSSPANGQKLLTPACCANCRCDPNLRGAAQSHQPLRRWSCCSARWSGWSSSP